MLTRHSKAFGATCRNLVAGFGCLLFALLASSLNPVWARDQAVASTSIVELEAKVKELGGQRFGSKTIAEIAEMTEKAQDGIFDTLDRKGEDRARIALGQYAHAQGLTKIAKKEVALEESRERNAKLAVSLVGAANRLAANWETIVRHDPMAHSPTSVLANVREVLGLPDLPPEVQTRLRTTFGRYLGP